MEKKTKSAPKEKAPVNRCFWFGFEVMEKLAIEEGAPKSFVPASIHALMKNGLSDKEAKELLKSVISYPHVGQTLFPIIRPDGIVGQHYNLTQLPFEVETDPTRDYPMTTM
jgi:hypothetical protein